MKPKRIPIDQNPGQFIGCCYDRATHQCPCFTPEMDNVTGCVEVGGYWVTMDGSSHWHPTCRDPNGDFELVTAPKWFLFAGQGDAGNVMDFAAEVAYRRSKTSDP